MIKIIIMFKTIPIKVKFYTAKEFLLTPGGACCVW